jgi:hypothetical protein
VRATSASCTAVIHGSSFSSSVPGRKPSSAFPTGTTGRYNRHLVVQVRLHDLLEPRGQRQDRLAGAGHAVERDHTHVRIEQEVEGELLLLRPRPQPPRLGHALQRLELAVHVADERRLAPRAQHRVAVEEVLSHGVDVGRLELLEADAAGLCVERIDGGSAHLDGGPPRGALERGATAQAVVFHGLQAQLRRLDAQRGVVRHDHRAAVGGLAERGGEDPVVVLRGSRPCSRISLRWRPFVSIRSVPPLGSGTGWRMSPSFAVRSSSMARITARAARPTSSMRLLC